MNINHQVVGTLLESKSIIMVNELVLLFVILVFTFFFFYITVRYAKLYDNYINFIDDMYDGEVREIKIRDRVFTVKQKDSSYETP